MQESIGREVFIVSVVAVILFFVIWFVSWAFSTSNRVTPLTGASIKKGYKQYKAMEAMARKETGESRTEKTIAAANYLKGLQDAAGGSTHFEKLTK